MLKKYLKILITLLTGLQLTGQVGCKLPEETEPELPNYTYETGMWFVGSLNTGGDARYVKGSFVNGTQYAFLADGQKGLEIINISNASSPSLTYKYNTNGFVKEIFIDSLSTNKYAFLSDEDKGLFILNISNPSNPSLDTLIAYPGGVNTSFTKDGFLFIALKQGSVKILNIGSLPDSVYEVSSYTPQNAVGHLEISGSFAYLSEKTSGLEIAEIINQSTLTFRSILNTSGSCNDLKIADNLAYIANGTAGICVMNVSNPSQPYVASLTNTESDVRGIDYTTNFIFTGEYNMGAEVLNTFNPIYPNAFVYYETSGYCYGVHFFKNKILIANGQYGLLILRY